MTPLCANAPLSFVSQFRHRPIASTEQDRQNRWVSVAYARQVCCGRLAEKRAFTISHMCANCRLVPVTILHGLWKGVKRQGSTKSLCAICWDMTKAGDSAYIVTLQYDDTEDSCVVFLAESPPSVKWERENRVPWESRGQPERL